MVASESFFRLWDIRLVLNPRRIGCKKTDARLRLPGQRCNILNQFMHDAQEREYLLACPFIFFPVVYIGFFKTFVPSLLPHKIYVLVIPFFLGFSVPR